MHNNELLDLVDKNDEIIGTIWRSEYDRLEKEQLGYIRAVELFIQNDQGQLWIPTRTAAKKIAPNGLDYSAGGHVTSGETYLEAMIKEIAEELNIDVAVENLELLGAMEPGDGPRYFREIYRYRTNQTPQYNTEDFVGAKWMTVDELVALLESGTPAKDSILPTVVRYYDVLKTA